MTVLLLLLLLCFFLSVKIKQCLGLPASVHNSFPHCADELFLYPIQTIPRYITICISESFSKFLPSYQRLNPTNMVEQLSDRRSSNISLTVKDTSGNKHSLKVLITYFKCKMQDDDQIFTFHVNFVKY